VEKSVIIKVEDLDVIGQLKYGNDNKSEIFLTLPLNKSHYFKKLYDNLEAFNINGQFEDDCQFTAFYCYVVQLLLPTSGSLFNDLIAVRDFYSNEESNTLIKYRIEIGKLYLNASDVNDETSVNKVDVKFSSIEQQLLNNENKKIFIKQNDCYITISNDFITIEPLHVITLKKLNQILFDLRVFFEVFVLNNDVKIIEKFIYTVDDTKIEEVMRYKSEQLTKEEFLFRYDTNSIESILNHWFEAKNTYGKIFDYLSGILNESSIVHLELKYFALAQWIEAYSREFLNNKIQTIINEPVENSDDQKLLLSQSQNSNNFRKNLKDMFKLKDLKILIGIQNSEDQKIFIDQIICYRNHLTHINIESKLNNTQIMHLYEILKDIIYILIIKELDVAIDSKRIDEIKRKYIAYKSLQNTIKKCE
jgi:hypothetical protein